MPAMERATAELRLSPQFEDTARLYSWLEEATAARGLAPVFLYKVHVAAEEAVMNVARYAFPPGSDGVFSVRLTLTEEALTLLVEDSGRPFDPLVVPEPVRPASLLDAKPGGLGISLMRHNCRDISYERVGGVNRLTLRFPREPA